MGVRIIENIDGACFYDSVTEKCFGYLMNDEEEAESFMLYCHNKYKVDLRSLTDKEIENYMYEFRELREKDVKE